MQIVTRVRRGIIVNKVRIVIRVIIAIVVEVLVTIKTKYYQ